MQMKYVSMFLQSYLKISALLYAKREYYAALKQQQNWIAPSWFLLIGYYVS